MSPPHDAGIAWSPGSHAASLALDARAQARLAVREALTDIEARVRRREAFGGAPIHAYARSVAALREAERRLRALGLAT